MKGSLYYQAAGIPGIDRIEALPDGGVHIEGEGFPAGNFYSLSGVIETVFSREIREKAAEYYPAERRGMTILPLYAICKARLRALTEITEKYVPVTIRGLDNDLRRVSAFNASNGIQSGAT